MSNSSFDRISQDIRSAKNLDLYITIFIAFALIGLDIFGINVDKFFTPLSMAILAILANSIASLKHDLSVISENLKPSERKPEFILKFSEKFSLDMERAHEIWFSGTHIASVLTSEHSLLKNKLKRGLKLRFLLICPHGESAVMATKRFAGSVPDSQEKERILTSLQIISKLKDEFEDQIEVRVIDFPLDSTTYYINPGCEEAIIYVEKSTYKISGGVNKPKFIYKPTDGKWFSHVEDELKMLWEDARQWNAATHQQ